MSTVTIQPGEYPAARVRHTSYAYSAVMTWGPDERATARFWDGARDTYGNVTEAAWQARVKLGAKYNHGTEFVDRGAYMTVVGHIGGGEYVVTFIPRYMIGGE